MNIFNKPIFDPYIAPYIVTAARIIAFCMIAAGCAFYWKIGIGTTIEDKKIAFYFGSLPILYGSLIALMSLKPDKKKRIKILKNIVAIPILFGGVSLAAAMILSALL